jgi:hypothetical protein
LLDFRWAAPDIEKFGMFSLLRRSKLLCALIVCVITLLFGVPWKTIGNTIVQQQEEDDDNKDDDSESDASCDPCHRPQPPRPQPPRRLVERPRPHKLAPYPSWLPAPTPRRGALWNTPLRLQI